MRAQRQARIILTDAHTIATLIDTTITNLDLGLGGWPTQTPGASPTQAQGTQECPARDCNNNQPCDTHGGDLPLDKARTDLEHLTAALQRATHHTAIAAAICLRWGFAGIDATSVRERLHVIDAEIWCQNCSRYGRHETRAPGRLECDFCADFRQKRKRSAPREIWEARDARGGRLDETTIVRILKRVDDDRKANAAAARQRQRTEQKVS